MRGCEQAITLSLLVVLATVGAVKTSDCTNNFTTVDELASLPPQDVLNITLLPDLNERDEFNNFLFALWIFPNMRFGCNGNLSRIVVKANTSVASLTPPRLTIWEEQLNTGDGVISYARIQVNISDGEIGDRNTIVYTFNPPLEVTDNQFVGFAFNHTRKSYQIAFRDLGNGSAPTSIHVSTLAPAFSTFIEVSGVGVMENSRYVPLIAAEFVQPPVTGPPPSTTTLPPTVPTPSLTTSPPTPTTTPPTLPPTQEPVVVDIGLIAGVVVTVLLVILIILLAIIIGLIVVRKRSQQKVYKEPVEPLPANLDNPVYGGDPGMTELGNSSHHIYATPSPTISPHPPHESLSSPTTPHESQHTPTTNHHYEFAEGYVPNGTEPHYEIQQATPGVIEDPEYAQPGVSIQPYEVPLTALQQAGQRVSPTLPVSDPKSKEHIYSVLEEGIYVPTEEERKPYPYSEATIINGSTLTNNLNTTIYAELGKKYEGSLTRDGFFQQEDSYWQPASSQVDLYNQLSKRKYREIVRQKIQIIKHLGSGQFGTVNMGVWTTSTESVEVAVKTLQPMASEADKVKFLQEAAIMGQFLHPNVVKLYGVVTVGEPVMIVLEYMEKGDLRDYLISRRPQPGELVLDDLPQTLLRFCLEISAGMNYLANKAFVHRDLAARNVLLSSDGTCKIGDFGMSRDLEDNNYYITHGGKIPVKWTAPEALNFRKYSTASDVWSFGCVMYEIWSLGHKPFEGFSNIQCMQLIGNGFRLAPPPGCPRPLYELMIRSWHSNYSVRPTFSAIFNMLSHSPSHLLSWSEKDLNIHPQVACLGAPLEITEELYPELQDYYMISGSINIKGRSKKGSKTADW